MANPRVDLVLPENLVMHDHLSADISDLATTLSGYVLLAPSSSTRNVIQPTGDYVPLTLKLSNSQTQNAFELKNYGGTTYTKSLSYTGDKLTIISSWS